MDIGERCEVVIVAGGDDDVQYCSRMSWCVRCEIVSSLSGC